MSTRLTKIATSLCVFFLTHQSVSAESRTPPEAIELNNKACNLMNRNEYEEAKKLLHKSISLDSNYRLPRCNLSVVLYNQSLGYAEAESALSLIEQSLHWDPFSQASYLKGNKLIEHLGLNPDSATDRIELANRALTRGDLGAFLVELQEAREIMKESLSPECKYSRDEFYERYGTALARQLSENWNPANEVKPFEAKINIQINRDGSLSTRWQSKSCDKQNSDLITPVCHSLKKLWMLYGRDRSMTFKFSFLHSDLYNDVRFCGVEKE